MRLLNVAIGFVAAATLLSAETAQQRLEDTTAVFKEVMSTPDKGIPRDLFNKARCIVIIPGMKSGAVGIGGKFGRGYATCRNETGAWSAPAAMRVEGGSVGFQIGGQSTDVIMLVMNERGMHHLLESKFTLGGDVSVAAGPVGRDAEANTDATMEAEILSWSRSRGIFAGVSLQGATLRNDDEGNHEVYGKNLTSKEILNGNMTVPGDARSLIAELDRYSAEHGERARKRADK